MITVTTREEFLKALKAFLPVYPIVAEIGVLHGDFSEMILNILNPAHLTLIDPYEIGNEYYEDGNMLTTAYSTTTDYINVVKRFSKEIAARKVCIERLYSFEAAKIHVDKIFDAAYIDASHLYKDVKRDLNDWLPKITEQGIMCGHDYVSLGNFGVIQAINEFCEEYNFEMIIYNCNGSDWALKKSNQ